MIIHHGFTNWHWVFDITRDSNTGAVESVVPSLVGGGISPGLAPNPNLAAGFLALGIVYLMTTPHKWLSIPLIMALLFTGSRWGLVVVAIILVAMVVTRTISWKPLLAAVGAIVITVALVGALTPSGYAVASYDSVGAAFHAAERGVNGRLAIPHIPSFLPSGVAEHPGLHNVPLRIAVESGIVAAALWVGITGLALVKGWKIKGWATWKPPRGLHPPEIGPESQTRVFWWLLLTLVLLSMLDYYSWMGHLGGFWWLLVGVLVKPNPVEDCRPASVNQG